MFRKMPFILVALIVVLFLLTPVTPYSVKQLLLSISLSIKSIIILLLPFIIFGLLFKTTIQLSSGATKIIGSILLLICCSNFISTFLSHYIGVSVYHMNLSMIMPSATHDLTPFWTLNLPHLIANDWAMFSGITLGLFLSKLAPNLSRHMANRMDQVISILLQGIIYLIPLFVAGFVVKLQYDGVIGIIIKEYSIIFLLIALALFTYISLAYLCFNQCRISGFLANIKNMLPAVISGFSTMSSAASMPLTIIGAENNAHNKDLARAVVPVTVNIHLVGDCFAIPIFAFAILKSFGMEEPSLLSYVTFTCYFVLAKFSVAAIPGGGILVMLPILEAYLGFNSEMMSLITALYILFDPVITCANVLGNGAFAKMIDTLALILQRKTTLDVQENTGD